MWHGQRDTGDADDDLALDFFTRGVIISGAALVGLIVTSDRPLDGYGRVGFALVFAGIGVILTGLGPIKLVTALVALGRRTLRAALCSEAWSGLQDQAAWRAVWLAAWLHGLVVVTGDLARLMWQTRADSDQVEAAASRFDRWLDQLFPAAFVEQFGEDMALDFGDAYQQHAGEQWRWLAGEACRTVLAAAQERTLALRPALRRAKQR